MSDTPAPRLAALGQPFGYGAEDLRALHAAADLLAARAPGAGGAAAPEPLAIAERLRALASRLAALLPPAGREGPRPTG